MFFSSSAISTFMGPPPGSVMRASVPPPSAVARERAPPAASTNRRERESPTPEPCTLSVKKGSKTFSASSAGMPLPRSRTAITTGPSPGRAPTSISRRRSGRRSFRPHCERDFP